MKIQLSDQFNYGKLLRFTLPPIIMMIFTSVYSMVDGLFISNFVGITPFAADDSYETVLLDEQRAKLLSAFCAEN